MSSLREKQAPLLPSVAQDYDPALQHSSKLYIPVYRYVLLLLGIAYLGVSLTRTATLYLSNGVGAASGELCAQAEVLTPQMHADLWDSLGDTIQSDQFKTRAINWLSGAVQIPTESFDKMDPVGKDARWESFGPFHEYLATAFPQVHASLELSKINTYGLLYVWKGSDEALKPLLLMAHQDVVPVEPSTVGDWTHPPYSGYFDGKLIWGRGSSDDKGSLIAILSTVESLLERGFHPARTVVLSFGFDEEASGFQGAGNLSKVMLERFGEDAFAMIIDEGGGYSEQYGTIFATPAIAEKGYLDTRVEVLTAGGHSSIPPPHTSIGILAKLLVEVESHPFETPLTRNDPFYRTLQCVAEHAPSLPRTLRKAIRKSIDSNKALRTVEKIIYRDPTIKNLIGTTQAIDLIQGGVKTNALPEHAWAVINHRISTSSSVGATMARDQALLENIVKKLDLTYVGFDNVTVHEGSKGTVRLSDAFGLALEPAPVTPHTIESGPWRLLSGTIKATYNAHRKLEGGENIAVAPSMMSGNTDTRYFWNLSKHIFRYNHSRMGSTLGGGIHTVNENIEVDAYLEMILFFTGLILNADEAITL